MNKKEFRKEHPATMVAEGYSLINVKGIMHQTGSPQPYKAAAKQERNSICNCGSGKKYKHCCGK